MSKVSVITVCFQAARTLGATIDSVRRQTHPEVEHIVIDGGSTDGTVEVARARGERIARFVSEPDGGIYDAMNKGIALATGEVVGLLNADDVYAHDRVLERVMARMEDPAVEAVYGDLQYVREGKGGGPWVVVRHWRSGEYDRRKLGWGWMPPHPALYLRRSAYERAALPDGRWFDTSYRCAADYDFMLRVLSGCGVRPAYLPEVLTLMRTGGVSNRSVGHVIRKSVEDWRAIRRNRIGHLHTLIGKNVGKLGQFWARGGSGGE